MRRFIPLHLALVLAGYKDGDINTEETIVKFTWSPGQSGLIEPTS